MNKKVSTFQIQDILPIGLTFVVLGIGLAYGLNVMGDVRDDGIIADTNYGATGCTGSDAWNCSDAQVNATVDAINGVAKLPEKIPLIATVVVAAIIIGILVRYLFVKYG